MAHRWGEVYDKKIAQLDGVDGYGGLDISSGRNHPAHLAILKRDIVSSVFYQVGSVWVDPPFTIAECVDYIAQVCAQHSVVSLAYDATRAELQAMLERGELPPGWKPVTFTVQSKRLLAGRLNWALQRGLLRLLPDDRQMRSVLQVDMLLRAASSALLGHGDAFWSLALAVYTALEGQGMENVMEYYGFAVSPELVLCNARDRGFFPEM